jgi:hypothetical protein
MKGKSITNQIQRKCNEIQKLFCADTVAYWLIGLLAYWLIGLLTYWLIEFLNLES